MDDLRRNNSKATCLVNVTTPFRVSVLAVTFAMRSNTDSMELGSSRLDTSKATLHLNTVVGEAAAVVAKPNMLLLLSRLSSH